MQAYPFNKEAFLKLQQEILQMQGFKPPGEKGTATLDLGPINRSFPNYCFPTGGVHEFVSTSLEAAAATTGFIAGLLKTLMGTGACLWVGQQCRVFPPGLKTFGIAPDRILFVNTRTPEESLWVIEEGLKCRSLSAVVGEITEFGFTASRRLQLAVEQSHVTGLIHRNTIKPAGTTACVARWQITSLPSINEEGMPGIGFMQWNVTLQKIRNGKPGSWQVRWLPGGFRITDPVTGGITVPMRKTG